MWWTLSLKRSTTTKSKREDRVTRVSMDPGLAAATPDSVYMYDDKF